MKSSMSAEEFERNLFERIENLLEIASFLDEELEQLRALIPAISKMTGHELCTVSEEMSLSEKLGVMFEIIAIVRSRFCQSLPLDTLFEIDRMTGTLSDTQH